MRALLFVKQDGKCFWCSKQCVQRYETQLHFHHDNFTLDHVQPKSVGGCKRDIGNAVGACERCNQYRNVLFEKMRAGRPINDFLTSNLKLKKKLIESLTPYLALDRKIKPVRL